MVIDSRNDATRRIDGQHADHAHDEARRARAWSPTARFATAPSWRRWHFPTWCAGVTATTRLSYHHVADLQVPIGCAGVAVYPGDVIHGDADNITVVPAHLAEEMADTVRGAGRPRGLSRTTRAARRGAVGPVSAERCHARAAQAVGRRRAAARWADEQESSMHAHEALIRRYFDACNAADHKALVVVLHARRGALLSARPARHPLARRRHHRAQVDLVRREPGLAMDDREAAGQPRHE